MKFFWDYNLRLQMYTNFILSYEPELKGFLTLILIRHTTKQNIFYRLRHNNMLCISGFFSPEISINLQ